MKTTPLSSILCILSLMIALTLGAGRLLAEQPEMNMAIEQLEMAKKGAPIEHLEKAKHHLEEAKRDKGGERVEAIHQIDEAIAAARKDEHKRMEEHIDKAIADVREGKHDARK
jgi:Small metal-binding protein